MGLKSEVAEESLHANPIIEYCKFNERCCQPEKTVATLLAELRNLVNKCDYREQLTMAFRDKLMCKTADD